MEGLRSHTPSGDHPGQCRYRTLAPAQKVLPHSAALDHPTFLKQAGCLKSLLRALSPPFCPCPRWHLHPSGNRKCPPKKRGCPCTWGDSRVAQRRLMRNMVAKSTPQQQPYFGGPEAKLPTSSNKSSCERQDFALTGVSCSITCISDSTEWETELGEAEQA